MERKKDKSQYRPEQGEARGSGLSQQAVRAWAAVARSSSGKRLRDYECRGGGELQQRSCAGRGSEASGKLTGIQGGAGRFTRKVRFSGPCEIDFIFVS